MVHQYGQTKQTLPLQIVAIFLPLSFGDAKLGLERTCACNDGLHRAHLINNILTTQSRHMFTMRAQQRSERVA